MLFSPETDETTEFVMPPGMGDVLEQVGLGDEYENPEVPTDPNRHVQSILKANKASMNDVARVLGNTLRTGDSDNAKLKAAEMILKMNKAPGFTHEDDVPTKAVFNITIVGSQNKALINVLIPEVVTNGQ